MHIKTKKYFFLVLISLIILSTTSCKKDEPAPTKSEIIVDGIWNFDKKEVFIDDELVDTDIYENDQFEFISDNTAFIYSNDEITNSLEWEISANVLSMNEVGSFFVTEYTIETLNSSDFVFSHEDGSYRVILTLSR